MTDLTLADKETIAGLILELAVEIDLHYETSEFFALAPTFARLKDGVALLERHGHHAHPDAYKIIDRFNTQRQ